MDDLGLPPFQETSMWRCEILRYDGKNGDVWWKQWDIQLHRDINGDMKVSINGDTPKLMVYNGNSYLNVWVGGNPILGNLHMEERGFTKKKVGQEWWVHHESHVGIFHMVETNSGKELLGSLGYKKDISSPDLPIKNWNLPEDLSESFWLWPSTMGMYAKGGTNL